MNHRVALTGMMGSGKSAVGRILAVRLGVPFVDLDETIEAGEGRSIAEIFEGDGEEAFRAIESAHLAGACVRPRAVISTGGGVVLRAENRAALRRWGIVVYLRAAASTLAARLSGTERARRPLLAGADAEERLLALLASRRPFYEEADLVVDTDGLTPEEVAALIATTFDSGDEGGEGGEGPGAAPETT